MNLTIDDDTFFARETPKLDTRPLTFSQDPLALSWASYWITKKNPQRRWTDLKDLSAGAHDIAMAEITRKYYRDKIMMKNLRGVQMTKFQQDLYDICNGGTMTHGHLGMLYRLPYFYEEDTVFQELITNYKSVEGRPGSIAERHAKKLTPLKRIIRSRAKNEVAQFWFKDEYNCLVLWNVTHSNSLRPLVESIFEKGDITVSAFFHVQGARHTDQKFLFWHIGDVRLV